MGSTWLLLHKQQRERKPHCSLRKNAAGLLPKVGAQAWPIAVIRARMEIQGPSLWQVPYFLFTGFSGCSGTHVPGPLVLHVYVPPRVDSADDS